MTVANAKPDLLITGPLGTTTVNAASSLWSAYTGVEAKITAAIAYAVSIGAKAVYVPDCFLPYTASLVTFNQTVRMTREGGNPAVFDVRAYGAAGDGVTNDTYAFVAAIQGAGTVISPNGPGGQIWIPPTFANVYLLGAAGAMSATEVLQLYGAIRLTAAGGGDASPTLRLANGANLSMIGVPVGVQGLIIEALHLDGNGANQSGTSHVLWFKGNGSYQDSRNVVRDVFIEKALTNGVRIDGQTSEFRFDQVIVRNCTGDNWNVSCFDSVFVKCDAGTSAAGYGWNVQTGFNAWYEGASFANALDNVLVGPSAVFNRFDGMDIDSAQNHGVHIQGNHTSFIDCDFKDNGQAAATTYSHVVVDAGLLGIRVLGNSFKALSKANQAAYAIRITGAVTHSSFIGNTQEPNSSAARELLPTQPYGEGFVYEDYYGRYIGAGFAGSVRTIASGATIAVDCTQGPTFLVGPLGVNVTAVSAPTSTLIGMRITYVFIQDGTGGRTVGGWNAVFKQAWSDTGNTLGKRSSISFIFDGTNWNQDGAQSPYA